MSLDITLVSPIEARQCVCACCGNEHTSHRAEEAFRCNITHNLGRMAQEAGIYEIVWRPEEIGVATASQIIEPLRAGIKLMEDEPERFRALNASNGWGTYDQFLPWLRDYLAACIENPDATIEASR